MNNPSLVAPEITSQEPIPAPAAREAQIEDPRSYVLAECLSMMRYAWANGLSLPEEFLNLFEMLEPSRSGAAVPSLAALSALHGGLARLVAPAMPRTIHLLETDPVSRTPWGILGPLPNVRRLMVAALCFITLFLAFAQSPVINTVNLGKLFSELDGLELLIVMGFYMSAAGLGACFNALFKAHSYISRQTYDPRYDSSYWIRLALGVIAGFLLAQLLPIENLQEMQDTNHDRGVGLAKPVFAVLGGFSASLVHLLLERLVETVESLFRNGSRVDHAPVIRQLEIPIPPPAAPAPSLEQDTSTEPPGPFEVSAPEPTVRSLRRNRSRA